MQEIRHNFNGIAKDFNEVKKTLSFQQILTLSILGMLVVNIFFTYLSRPKKDDTLEKQLTEKTEEIISLEKKLESVNTDFEQLKKENTKLKKEVAEFKKEKESETPKEEKKK